MKDVAGKQFGRLTVISEAERRGINRMVLCRCSCGTERVYYLSNVTSGKSQSCGCLKRERTIQANKTIDDADKRLHETWSNMKARCLYPSVSAYKYYGGRGITFCEEWKDFAQFAEWAHKNGYNDTLTIDRIDVNGNYCPENCRWVTKSEQMNNKRTNRLIEFSGEIKTVAQWAHSVGIDHRAMWDRLFKQKMPLEKALTSPNLASAKQKNREEVKSEQ